MNKFENEYFAIELKEDGILYVKFPEVLDEEMVDSIIKRRLEITKEDSYPAIVDAREVIGLTKEARNRFYQKDSQKGTLAAAFIISSKVQKIFYNMFLIFNSAPIPTKIFISEEKAKEWVKRYMK